MGATLFSEDRNRGIETSLFLRKTRYEFLLDPWQAIEAARVERKSVSPRDTSVRPLGRLRHAIELIFCHFAGRLWTWKKYKDLICAERPRALFQRLGQKFGLI